MRWSCAQGGIICVLLQRLEGTGLKSESALDVMIKDDFCRIDS